MTGTDIVGTLLREDAAMLALLPDINIVIGRAADRTPLPIVILAEISSNDRQTLKRGQTVRVTDRVSVTVRARTHRERVAIIAAARSCCAGRVGNIGGGTSVSILTAGRGPDLNGPANSFEKTQDFRVSYDSEVDDD